MWMAPQEDFCARSPQSPQHEPVLHQASCTGEGAVKTIRPSMASFLIFGGIGLIISLPGFDSIVRLGQWEGTAFVLIGGLFAVVPMSRYRISWDNNDLNYRGLISHGRIRFCDIRKFDFHGPSRSRFEPTLGLRLFSKSSNHAVAIINVKPFAGCDIAALVQRLNEATS